MIHFQLSNRQRKELSRGNLLLIALPLSDVTYRDARRDALAVACKMLPDVAECVRQAEIGTVEIGVRLIYQRGGPCPDLTAAIGRMLELVATPPPDVLPMRVEVLLAWLAKSGHRLSESAKVQWPQCAVIDGVAMPAEGRRA